MDSRFQIRQFRENRGWIRNVNSLIDSVETEYFTILSHDDLWKSEYLGRLVALLEANPEALAAYSDMEFRSLDDSKRILQYLRLPNLKSPLDRGLEVLEKGGYWWLLYRSLVRSQRVRGELSLKRNFQGAYMADLPFVLAIVLRGEVVRWDCPAYIKIVRRGSASSSWLKRSYAGDVAVRVCCLKEIINSPISLENKVELSSLIVRLISKQSKVVFWEFLRSCKRESRGQSVRIEL